jgi:wyosine [tRNA(Phe)-imidazoG37] synthetase (radical SAM superfamily)
LRRKPDHFHEPGDVAEAVGRKVQEAGASGQQVDYLTFVADGEPTLDRCLGRTIEELRPLGVPIAVITNGSLLDRREVRRALLLADLVSLKVDAVGEEIWSRINRPHPNLRLPSILDGMLEFRGLFAGTVITETMLIRDLNDGQESLNHTAAFLERLNPGAAYLGIPTRPPAETWAEPPHETAIARAFQIFNARVRHTEYLIGYEGNAFSSSGDAEADILAITAVHPMREDAVRELLDRSGARWSAVRRMIDEHRLVEVDYQRRKYYLRKFPSASREDQDLPMVRS